MSHPVGEKLSTSLFAKLKDLLSLTGGDSKARKFYGIYRVLSEPTFKFFIHKGKEELFKVLTHLALRIRAIATKKRNIRNLQGDFSGVL